MHVRARRSAAIGVSVILAIALAACTSGAPSKDAPDAASMPAAEGTTVYPLELPTDYGTTTLEERPRRVAVIGGLQDLEAVLALDVIPVLASENDWPWVAEAGGDQIAESFDVWAEDGLPFEDILAAQPDVIVAASYGDLEADYDRLATIAPVVAMETYKETEAWQVDWKDLTRTVGVALDLSAAAEDVIDESDALVADTAATHPEWAGLTTTFLMNRGEDAGLQVLNIAGSPAEDLLLGLGFAAQPHAAELVATDGAVSVEQIGLLDGDTLVIAEHGGHGTPEEATSWLEQNQLYQSLGAVQAGRVGVIPPDEDGALPIAWAFSYPNALSIAYTVNELTGVYNGIVPR